MIRGLGFQNHPPDDEGDCIEPDLAVNPCCAPPSEISVAQVQQRTAPCPIRDPGGGVAGADRLGMVADRHHSMARAAEALGSHTGARPSERADESDGRASPGLDHRAADSDASPRGPLDPIRGGASARRPGIHERPLEHRSTRGGSPQGGGRDSRLRTSHQPNPDGLRHPGERAGRDSSGAKDERVSPGGARLV